MLKLTWVVCLGLTKCLFANYLWRLHWNLSEWGQSAPQRTKVEKSTPLSLYFPFLSDCWCFETKQLGDLWLGQKWIFRLLIDAKQHFQVGEPSVSRIQGGPEGSVTKQQVRTVTLSISVWRCKIFLDNINWLHHPRWLFPHDEPLNYNPADTDFSEYYL